jgi:hypothetical protein
MLKLADNPNQSLDNPEPDNPEHEEGEYETLVERLKERLQISRQDRARTCHKSLPADVGECTKILRYLVKDLYKSSRDRYKALAIDALWKLTILDVDSLLEHEKISVEESFKQGAETEHSAYVDMLDKCNHLELQLRAQELQWQAKVKELQTSIQQITEDNVHQFI